MSPTGAGSGHLFHAVGNCCTLCGVPLRNLELGIGTGDGGARIHCPGGPDTNLRGVSHLIALKKLAKLMHYDDPPALLP